MLAPAAAARGGPDKAAQKQWLLCCSPCAWGGGGGGGGEGRFPRPGAIALHLCLRLLLPWAELRKLGEPPALAVAGGPRGRSLRMTALLCLPGAGCGSTAGEMRRLQSQSSNSLSCSVTAPGPLPGLVFTCAAPTCPGQTSAWSGERPRQPLQAARAQVHGQPPPAGAEAAYVGSRPPSIAIVLFRVGKLQLSLN